MSINIFQVENAGSQLQSFATRLEAVEKSIVISADTGEEVDNESVMELLDSMNEVKNEYKNLRKDIKEVQELQKEMNNSLRYQMRTMTQTFHILKKKIESKAASQN